MSSLNKNFKSKSFSRVAKIPPVGFSNGWLNAKLTKSFLKQSKIFQEINVNTCEICSDEEIGIKMINRHIHLDSKSIHLPNFTNFNKASKAKLNIIGKSLRRILDFHEATRATIHVDLITPEIVEWLKKWDIPFGLENMDRNKSSGKLPIEVIRCCNDYKVPLVLDLQHAYEVSLDVYGAGFETEIAVQLAKLAKKSCGISQIHASGEISNRGIVKHNHSLIAFSTNKRHILDALIAVQNILGGDLPPIILEGDYLPFLSLGEKEGKALQIHSNTAIVNMNMEKKLIFDELRFSNEQKLNSNVA